MKGLKFLILIISVFIVSCQGRNLILNEVNERYKNHHLKKFNQDFVSHFPDKISSLSNRVISTENVPRGFIGMLLYEYNINVDSLIKIEDRLKSISIKKYNSDADCLLVINRFDTLESSKFPEGIILPDSVQLNKSCYDTLLPIPKFYEYESEVYHPKKQQNRNEVEGETMLPSGFNIYVLEAKPGKYFEKYDIIPNRQMPDGWKNGYSKGVAISVKYQTIIYWSVAF
jgi:hypothetical protein